MRSALDVLARCRATAIAAVVLLSLQASCSRGAPQSGRSAPLADKQTRASVAHHGCHGPVPSGEPIRFDVHLADELDASIGHDSLALDELQSTLRSSGVALTDAADAIYVLTLSLAVDSVRTATGHLSLAYVLSLRLRSTGRSDALWRRDHRDSVMVGGVQFIGTDAFDLLECFIVDYQTSSK